MMNGRAWTAVIALSIGGACVLAVECSRSARTPEPVDPENPPPGDPWAEMPAPKPTRSLATRRPLALRPGQPVVRVISTPAGPRWVSIMQIDADEPPGTSEPSDLDDDHPGAHWANAGFSTLRAVLTAHGVDAESAWCEPVSGEITAFERLPGGSRRFVSLSPDPVPGDLNGDDATDLADLRLFLSAMGDNQPAADVNDDGRITGDDAAAYLRSWATAR